ncbi:aldehyde dehydrogenase family protein [Sansalvadorimonas sp. 2012CJ34-2]|uniref:Aldehyde dehydrogenase n=1 Tax=Parendozoicomonas callyspongiae TaxID=2942213 RepID=A0ABT0PEF2_9GAMM|nr:aldehyde dehydrogenase family protein [Sansalvadorimonas sp. 2012CJ34-2]MCL6269411.1 aldehyde dehydrogenase family protein [Sansalvadorimonas sp. 2012CJ34-2]
MNDCSVISVESAVTGQAIYELNELSQDEVRAMFSVARDAATDLRNTPLQHRLDAVQQVMDHIRDNRDRIVDRLCDETGKTRTDALVSEILGVLDNLEWNIHNAAKILKDTKISTPITLLGKKSRIFHEPYGVIVKIAPWNYPFHIAMCFSLGAFIAGNAVILKPSELTPLRGLLEDILSVSPLIRHSLQIAYGTGITAQRLIAERPDKIFFTGSGRTGRRILKQAAELLIPAEMELGGKDQMIVFDDVNIDRTVAGAIWGAMTNAGQSCTSVERLYIHDNIYEEFLSRLVPETEKLIVNNGDRGDSDIGAITAGFQMDMIESHVEDARSKGAEILTGGARLGDNFYLPTIITGITPDMKLHNEETFGPLIPVYRFSDEKEVIRETNSFSFGLTASVWSKDLKRAERVARAIEVGAVSINNVMLTEGNPALPFGGQKESGFGRAKGAEGLLAFTRSKSILIDKQSSIIEPNWYPYTLKKYELFQELIQTLFTRSPIKLLKLALTGLKLENESKKSRID